MVAEVHTKNKYIAYNTKGHSGGSTDEKDKKE